MIEAVAKADDFDRVTPFHKRLGHPGHIARRTAAIGRENAADHQDAHRVASHDLTCWCRHAVARDDPRDVLEELVWQL